MTRRSSEDSGDREWMSVADLADWLDISPAVIYNQRWRGQGPRGVKVGRELRFRRTDVEQWLNSLYE